MATIRLSLSSKRNKELGVAEILMRFVHNPINQRAKTGIYVNPERWDNDRQIIIMPRIRCMTPSLAEELKRLDEATKELSDLKAYVMRRFTEMVTHNISIQSGWLLNVVEEFRGVTQEEEAGDFFILWDKFTSNRRVSNQRQAMYKVTKLMLDRYVKVKRAQNANFELSLNSLSNDLLIDFENFLRMEYTYVNLYPQIYKDLPRGSKPKKRGQNTISDRVSILRTFVMWATNNNYTQNDPFKLHKIKPAVYGTPIYINIEEREQLRTCDMPSAALSAVRDIFIFQCCIGCRCGDLLRMKTTNLVGDYIEYIPHKTKDGRPITVRVPLNETARQILKKYQGAKTDKLLPFISAQKYNEGIKKCFKVAGLDRLVTRLNTVTGEPEQKPLYEIASSHMARRTFIGNLYKKVQDPNLIGALSGHVEGSSAFARYRAIDDDMKKNTVSLLDV